MFVLESAATLPKEGIFALCGIALLAALYFVLKAFKKKEIPAEEPEENEEEIVAAITAAVALILEEEAEREERKPVPFRVVSFKRTNNRRI
ncbi:MAG: hypothetical protein J6S71_02025 [Clostridia bacterium]|nr:hypothetical protein [Clostridia bacterium]